MCNNLLETYFILVRCSARGSHSYFHGNVIMAGEIQALYPLTAQSMNTNRYGNFSLNLVTLNFHIAAVIICYSVKFPKIIV